jgi:thymidylate kinase
MTVTQNVAVHPALKQVFSQLSARALRWIVLRIPRGGLVHPLGDVDLLVHADDRRDAAVVVNAAGFAQVPRSGADAHFVRYVDQTDDWLWLHVTSELSFGPAYSLPVADKNGLLSSCRTLDGTPQLNADATFWTLLWHCLADKGHVAAQHRTALREAAIAADCHGDIARCFAAACGDATVLVRLRKAVIEDDWDDVEKCAGFRPRAQRRYRLNPLRRLRRAMRAADALLHSQTRRGLSVGVIGPDGAGKSTLVRGLRQSLPFPSRLVYMGLTGGALRHVRRLRVPGLVFAASALVIWSRYVGAWIHMRKGRLVIFDRYVYDAIAPAGFRQGPYGRLGRRLSRHLLPSPDLILLLDAPGTVMHMRKGEYDADTLERWRRDFLSLRAIVRRLEVVDASQSAATVRADAASRIWRRYVQHWHSAGGLAPVRRDTCPESSSQT